MDRFEATSLPGTENGYIPFFSPDGQWIGFFAGGKLKKVSVNGGQPITLCEAPTPRGASWGPDDTIVFTPTFRMSSLMRIPAAGGTAEKLTQLNTDLKEVTHRWPEILPGGKVLVFVIGEAKDIGTNYEESKIAVERLDTRQRKILPILGTYPRYSPSGHLLYVREGRIFAVPFDLNRLEVTGTPAPVLEGVVFDPIIGSAAYAVWRTGSLAYIPGSAVSSKRLLAWVDRKNQIQPLAAPAKEYATPVVSPDGQRVVVAIGRGFNTDVWVYDIPRGTLTRLTFDGHSGFPVWSPDGKRIAYMTRRGAEWEIRSKAADGSGAEETVLAGQDLIPNLGSWSPDGKFLAYTSMSPDTESDLSVLPLEGERKPRPFVQTKSAVYNPAFSPDGHWIAYMSNETGRFEVYVQPFPGPGGKWQVSTDGGGRPVWGRSGRELFYVNANKVMSVSVTTQPSFSASTPRFVADVHPLTYTGLWPNALYASPDGQRFLFAKASDENRPPGEVRVVLNWSEELNRLAPPTKKP
jgi:Tol biopolymer transport system component